MATLVLKNTTASNITITDASAVIVPASSFDTYTDAKMIMQLVGSSVLRSFVTGGQIVVNDGTSDLTVSAGLQYLAQLGSQQGFSTPPGTIGLYQMQLGGFLDVPTLPLSGCGIEIAQDTKTLTLFQGRRGTPGTSGTTTIQLELNGVVVVGATLSWTPSDGAFVLKTIAIAVSIVQGDRLSFTLTSAEVSGQDVFAEAD
jgi:hypothetical protein